MSQKVVPEVISDTPAINKEIGVLFEKNNF